LQEF
jgi:hypothetical protein